MRSYTLTSEQRAANYGYTDVVAIPYTDLTGTAGTALTQAIGTLAAGDAVTAIKGYAKTLFDGGATSELTFKIGWDSTAGSDDDDGLIEATSVHADATYVRTRMGNGAAFATKLTGMNAVDATTLNLIWTATGANLTTLTQGELIVWLKIERAAATPLL